jgi:DNA repair exonuclease SbcCD ATPase subunit
VISDHLGDKDALQATLTAIKTQYTVVKDDFMANSTKIAICEISVENLKKLQSKLDELNNQNKETVENIANLHLLKEAFGQNGIKAILIDYIIPKLEDSINNILSKLSDFRVRLDTQKKGVSEDVTKEGLFINIYNELGEQFDFDAFSGGEKVKISSAIFEALAEIQNIGFRVLDESIVALDEDSTEKFVEVMSSLQERVNQILCISHLRNIKDMFTEKITISKINGASKIV